MKRKSITITKKTYLNFVAIPKNSTPGKINCIQIDSSLNNYQKLFIWKQLKKDGYLRSSGKEYYVLTVKGYKNIPTER